MAHFAKLNSFNTVTEVVTLNNRDIMNIQGQEIESIGQELCVTLYGGTTSSWVQTSYNNKIRGVYAGIGYHYDATHNVFVNPHPVTTVTNITTAT